jgi:cell division protein FtsW
MQKSRYLDPVLLGLGVLATLLGVFFTFDAGYPREIANGRSPLSSFVIQQAVCGVLGIAAFYLLCNLKKKVILKLSIGAWVLSMIGLALCHIPGLAYPQNGAYRWFKLPGLPVIQPAEFVKLTTVLFLAVLLAQRGPWKPKPAKDIFTWLDKNMKAKFLRLVPGIAVLISVIVIEKEPDLGTGAIVLCIAIAMYLAAGVSKWSLTLVGGGLVVIVALMVNGAAYRMERINNHLHRWDERNMNDVGYQSVQAELAFSEGRWFGTGPGNGRAKHVLPAGTTDFVMATVGEEFGLVGSLAVITVLGLLTMRLFKLATMATVPVAKFLLMGVGSWIGIQSCVNIMMANSFVPPIGVPLPFVSYGGSSLLALWVALGIANASLAFKPEKEAAYAASGNRWGHRRPRLSGA